MPTIQQLVRKGRAADPHRRGDRGGRPARGDAGGRRPDRQRRGELTWRSTGS
jgi:hypothetical protein